MKFAKILFWASLMISQPTFAAVKLDQDILCKKDSQTCVTWRGLQVGKHSAYWRKKEVHGTNLGTRTLSSTQYKKETSFLSKIPLKAKSQKSCRPDMVFMNEKSGTIQLCKTALSKADGLMVESLFR